MMEQGPGRNHHLCKQAHTGAEFVLVAVACQAPTLEQSVPDVPEEDDPPWSRSWITAAHGKNPWEEVREAVHSMGGIPFWSFEGLL